MVFLVNLLVGLTMTFCVGLNDPGKSPGQYQDFALTQLKPNCYYNWGVYSENNLKNETFTPSMWSVNDVDLNYAVSKALKFPGRTWLIYNEPEEQGQSNTTPVPTIDETTGEGGTTEPHQQKLYLPILFN